MTDLKNSNRLSNLEFLRIISMLGIIASHCVTQGHAIDVANGFNFVICCFFNVFGKLGVHVFVILTSWFLVEKLPNIRRGVIRVWLTTFIYQITFSTSCYILHIGESNLNIIIKSMLPVIGRLNWYVTTYLIFLSLLPFFKIMLLKLEKKQMQLLLCILTFITVVFPYFLGVESYVNTVSTFCYIYVLVYYIKKYNVEILQNRVQNLLLCFFCIGAMVVLQLVQRMGYDFSFTRECTNLYSPFEIVAAFSIFGIFSRFHYGYNRTINAISKHTFAIFIIHTAYPIRYKLLWIDIFKMNSYVAYDIFPIYALGAIVLVFIVCLLIDMVVDRFILSPVVNSDVCAKFCERVNVFSDYSSRENYIK